MNIVKILTSDGKEIAVYPDAYALTDKEGYLFVFESSTGPEDRKYSYKDGNWIACFTGPVISWEEPQGEPDEHSKSLNTSW
jgi:hypothetical protein